MRSSQPSGTLGHSTPARPTTTVFWAGLLATGLLLSGCAATLSTETSAPATGATEQTTASGECAVLPPGFVFLTDINPDIQVDLRYAGTHNFTGEIVDGYEGATDVVLRTDAAEALSLLQEEFATQGYGLLVYDGFRPTRAVDHFVAWSHTPDDHTKDEFYPSLEKPELFEQGYIAAESNHSRGGTVDLTIIDARTGEPLDMGGEFDLFDERSHGDSAQVTPEQAAHRALLADAMIAAGFVPYDEEWWHYSYPVPETAEREDFALQRC